MKIRIEIEEPDARVLTSHAVADYVRAMLRVRSLRRAVGEALLEAEHCKKKLKAAQVLEAQRLLEGADRSPARSPLLRRPTKRPARPDRGASS